MANNNNHHHYHGVVQLTVIFLVTALCTGGYLITTPRQWVSGEAVQICVFTVNSPTATHNNNNNNNNTITVSLEEIKNRDDDDDDVVRSPIIPPRVINIPPDKSEHCDKLTLPTLRLTKAKLRVTGHVGGQRVKHHKKVKLAGRVTKTFVQTDKQLYKPGQDVQFRILTLTGPYLKLSTNQYPLVWVETPTGSRIAQWINVDNTPGLIHMAFTLSEEPEQGDYKIHVDSPVDGGSSVSQTFSVKEYTLPRFEVTITPPKLLFGNDQEFTVTVCAKYTYGQPVKGNVSLDLNNGGWGSSRRSHLVEGPISGCRDFPITADDVAMNGQHYHSQSLSVKAKVSEDGTGEAFEEISSIPIHRTRFNFKMVADEKFVKPGLPYTGKVKVELPDGSPAVGETLKVCAAGNCKNITTDSITGILTFVVPQYEDLTIRIESIEEDGSASTGGSWRRIMHSSQFHRTVKRYFSPSRSSLIIHAPTTTLPCLQGESYTHNLPLLYSITNQNSVNITVQVVSRGQIQFSSSEHHDLTTTTTPLPLHGTLLSPLTPVAADTVQGSLTLPLTLPPNASPTAKVIVWLTRSDGEVVSDARQLKVDTCYTNPVTVAWSTSKSQPGDEVDVSITSHPQSICSLGVVDKSVELLSSTSDPLTVSQVFGMVEQTMVPSHVNPQVDDNKYCKKMLRNPTTPSPVPEDTSEPDPFFFRPRPYYYPMDYYTEYVDALKMFDDSGLFVFSDLTVETRPCKERERVMWVALSAPADFVFERRQEGALPGPGSEVMELPPGNMISHDYDMVPDESSSVSSPQPRTYFPETWLWQLSVLPTLREIRDDDVYIVDQT
ncbi:hypothetical protein Pmani_003801 [Petrolisthes manimaculis]|uniref:TEP1-F n=1 Tax=Petrolisthes manimaculis TaxID=1843537 RepID=A0AAE1QI44_9EUCA|nr:hypothetical protein Pmani_003801 [Petrolisthes manimaculis]